MYFSPRFITALALTGLLPLTAAMAQDSPCAADIQKYCAQIEPGGGRINKCLTEHEKELSGVCRDYVKQAAAAMVRFNQACGDDARKFCTDVQPGGGRVLQCLSKKLDDLSKPCKEFLAAFKKRQ